MQWLRNNIIPVGLLVGLMLAGVLLAWQSYDTNQRAQEQVSQLTEVEPESEESEEPEPANDEAIPDTQDPEPKQEQNGQTQEKPSPTTATLEGSLTYPSSGIPSGMQVCAQNTKTDAAVCTTKHLQNSKYVYDLGYKISVKPGTYQVYALNPADNQPAYYNSYMKKLGTSGQWGNYPKNCANLAPIKLNVVAGQSYFDLTVGDWYYDAQCN